MITDVAVIVPAADEQDSIDACLTAARMACDAVDSAVRTRIVVVLDCCTDGTAAAVERHRDVEVVVSRSRRVGAARALGTAHVTSSTAGVGTLWLANTDADSIVAPSWLVQMLALADDGADLVLGTVIPGPELTARRRAAWSRLHHARDGHPHVHGANLGVRASALATLDGWRPLATGEDADLATRAAGAGLDIRRTGEIPVFTSARSVARAPEGFSSYLRSLG